MAFKRKVFFVFLLLQFSMQITKADFENCECDNADFIDPLPKITRVDNPTHQFIDEFGRSRWFHGTNVVSKSFPFHPEPDSCNSTTAYPFCEGEMDYFQELGVNAVRLGMMWEGAEPTRGIYNCTYFCVMHGIIQSLASRGIYTLVDVHQDVIGRQMCGEGVPDWFMKKYWVADESQRFPVPIQPQPFTTDENGIPDPWDQCWTITDWFLSYLTIAVGDAFDKFYTNHDGLLDSFSDYWGKIAWEYRNYSSVLGYDLLNEPWAGNIFKDPTLLIPGVADGKHLENVWQNCSAKIRPSDPETLIFFEGVTWDIRDGHTNVPGNDGSKAAMSYHYYAPPQLGLKVMYENKIIDQDRLQTGGMLTEFRMWAPGGGENAERIRKEMRDTIDMADEYLQSWMGWEYRHVLSRDPQLEKHYARTYAPAVAGMVVRMGFNEETAYYFITWKANTIINNAPTEVKINRRIYYPNGYEVKVTPSNGLSWREIDQQNLHFSYTQDAIDGQEITLEIIRNPGIPVTTESSNGNIIMIPYHLQAMMFLTIFLKFVRY